MKQQIDIDHYSMDREISLFIIFGTSEHNTAIIITLQVSIISLKWYSTMGIQCKYILTPIVLLFILF